jgi:hypothetical protein
MPGRAGRSAVSPLLARSSKNMVAPSRFDPLQVKARSLRCVSPSNGHAEDDLSCLFYYREIALNSFLMYLKETSSFFHESILAWQSSGHLQL